MGAIHTWATIRRTCLASIVVLGSAQATARVVLDPADPAFAGAVTVDLPPPGLLEGVDTFELTSNGVTVRLESTSGQPLVSQFVNDGVLVWSFADPSQGVVVTVNPPAAAVGFVASELDGCPGGDFVGADATENVGTPFGACEDAFFGAADIGVIGVVNLRRPSSVFVVHQIRFVAAAPEARADLAVDGTPDAPVALDGTATGFDLQTDNLGPDDASDVRVIDFPPHGTFTSAEPADGSYDATLQVLRWERESAAAGSSEPFRVDIMTPPRNLFSCESVLTNVATVTGPVEDPDVINNVAVDTIAFDALTASATGPALGRGEICGNGIDDECDGRTDCLDDECQCPPPRLPARSAGDPGCVFADMIVGPTGEVVFPAGCGPGTGGLLDGDEHECRVPRGACGGRVVPAYCCDLATWSDPNLNGSEALAACDVEVAGCAPVDPNYKTSDPTVNIAGYGYTEAGRTMTYTIHYENVGTADALDVRIVDPLDPDLDGATVVAADDGRYDPGSRSVIWTDPRLPPNEPRSVNFEVEVRSDAPPGTRVRNVATIVFPNAEPPSRIDTAFIEHVVIDPAFPPVPDLAVTGCTELAPGSWQVELLNKGYGFAYNVGATILDTPPGVTVTDATARFAHRDDENPNVLATVVPVAVTSSYEPVAFTAAAPTGCDQLTWRIGWENLQGERFSVDQAPTADDEPAQCDIDDDGDVDRFDTALITAARNTPAGGDGDPRDVDGDGTITVLDARQCVLECTRPGCAP